MNLGGDIINTIVFLGTQKSGSSRDAIRATNDLGFYTCLLTNNLKILNQRIEFPDVHLMQYCEMDKIEKLGKRLKHCNNTYYEFVQLLLLLILIVQ